MLKYDSFKGKRLPSNNLEKTIKEMTQKIQYLMAEVERLKKHFTKE